MGETLTPQPASVSKTSLTSFTEIWSETWRIYKHKFPIITLILLIPALIGVAIRIYGTAYIYQITLDILEKDLSSEQIGNMILPLLPAFFGGIIIFSLIAAAIGYFSSGTVLRVAHKADDEKATIGSSFQYVLKRLGTAIGLQFRIFIYVMIRLLVPLVIILAFGVLSSLISKSTESAVVTFVLPILSFAAMVAMIVLLIQASLRVSFAYTLLFMSENPLTSKEIFQKSLQLSQNLLWRIFANYFLLGLIFFLVGLLYGGALAVALPHTAYNPFSYMQQPGIEKNRDRAIESPLKREAVISESRNEMISDFKEELAVDPLEELAILPLTVLAGGFGLVFRSTFAKKALEEKEMAL